MKNHLHKLSCAAWGNALNSELLSTRLNCHMCLQEKSTDLHIFYFMEINYIPKLQTQYIG